ncbi:expressed unknown protein [Seminavis robusta]|uniref:Uncharacterized protein n=1 Tax=Seminavis robusta TaxID=568900 RepID=A0A9N8DYC3_9STRA|nr:expressed unknown protein [Seminavis robusta]|eukprot:Sro388_g132360.1 n/a (1051) ;mRNA; r:37664-40873
MLPSNNRQHSQLLLECRGGSTRHNINNKKNKRVREASEEEIDRYIDFLIATYCPATTTSNSPNTDTTTTRDVLPVQTNGNPKDTATILNADKERQAPTAREETYHSTASLMKAKALTKSSRNDVRRLPLDDETQIPEQDGDAASPLKKDDGTTTTTTSTFWEDTSEGAEQRQGGGGGGDDDDHDEDDETLDRYIEFLQEDYDNDRALDRYIDFLEQDYDADRALDRYIDFLLATTTSVVPQQQPQGENAILASSITTTIPAMDQAAVITAAPRESGEMEPDSPLDAYIDQLLTAVELDEYIDRLVATVSNRDLGIEDERDDKDERGVDVVAREEEEEEDALERYIDTVMATKLEDIDDQQQSTTALRQPAKETSTDPVEAVSRRQEEQVPLSAENVELADDESSARDEDAVSQPKERRKSRKKSRKPAFVAQSSESTTLADIDDEGLLQVDHDDVAVPAMGGDDDGDDDDDMMEAAISEDAEEPSPICQDKGAEEAEDDPFNESAPGVASVEEDAALPTVKRRKSTKSRKKKVVAATTAIDSTEETDSAVQESNVVKAAQSDGQSPAEPAEDEKDVEPIRVPNGLYRFLLGQGPIGHVLVLALVFVVEWVQLYVPQLSDLVAFLWVKLAPTGLQRSMAAREYLPGDGPKSGAGSMHQIYSGGRMPVKGKQRRKMSKQADQDALATLERVGDIQAARYKHVSAAFMRRHGLGPYHDEAVNAYAGDEDEDLAQSERKKKSKRSKKKRAYQYDEDEESDVDWVLDGLSAEKENDSPVTVKFGIGPTGPAMEVGLEMEFGGGSSRSSRKKRKKKSTLNAEALTRDSVRRRTSGPRPSDKDGGSGVVGQIRAAVTSNNLMSRSLLGAYPGDVVPPSEAGAASGVTSLARKYGYGEWGSSEKKPKKKKGKRRKKSDESSLLDGLESDDDNPFDADILLGDIPGDDDDPFEPPPLPRKKESKKRSSSSSGSRTSSSARRKDKLVRPALDLLDETASKKRRKKPPSDDRGRTESKPTSALEELSKKSTAKSKKSRTVKPAMSQLNDLKDRASSKNDDN